MSFVRLLGVLAVTSAIDQGARHTGDWNRDQRDDQGDQRDQGFDAIGTPKQRIAAKDATDPPATRIQHVCLHHKPLRPLTPLLGPQRFRCFIRQSSDCRPASVQSLLTSYAKAGSQQKPPLATNQPPRWSNMNIRKLLHVACAVRHPLDEIGEFASRRRRQRVRIDRRPAHP